MPIGSIRITDIRYDAASGGGIDVYGVCIPEDAANDQIEIKVYAINNNSTPEANTGTTQPVPSSNVNFKLTSPFVMKTEGYYLVQAILKQSNGTVIATYASPYLHQIPIPVVEGLPDPNDPNAIPQSIV